MQRIPDQTDLSFWYKKVCFQLDNSIINQIVTCKFIRDKAYAQIVDGGRSNQVIGIELDIGTELKAMLLKQRIPESAARSAMFHGNDREGKNIFHGKQLVFQIGITAAGDQYILKIRDRCDLKITEAFKGCDTQGKIGCFVVQRGHHSRKRVRVDLKPYIGKTVLKAFVPEREAGNNAWSARWH